jgi:hypothetical protein
MGLPQTPDFADLLRSVSLKRQPEWPSTEVFPEEVATDGQRIVARDPAITLWHSPGQISWQALVKRVQEELRNRKHKASVLLAQAIIAVYCLHPKKEEAPVESFNWMLDRILDAQLIQFFILVTEPPRTLARFSFGSFTLGALNSDRLASRSRRAGSDYHDRYGRSHLGKFTIERGTIPARIVDWHSMRTLFVQHKDDSGVWDRALHGYFSALSQEYFEDFWSDFVESQALSIALGAPYLAPQVFKLIPQSSSISIFIAEGWGHVAPHFAPTVLIDLVSADKRFKQIETELESVYHFAGFTDTDQHQTIKSYASFIGKGKQHLVAGNLGEGYLHHIIALDLVFGSEESISKTVTERVAMIVHKPLELTFDAALRLMIQAYSARSKYVHEGRSVSPTMISEVERITREVTLCLLRLQHSSRELAVHGWLANLDYFVKALQAGKVLQPEELRANGIATD